VPSHNLNMSKRFGSDCAASTTIRSTRPGNSDKSPSGEVRPEDYNLDHKTSTVCDCDIGKVDLVMMIGINLKYEVRLSTGAVRSPRRVRC
jgi:hypothetical protein